MTAVLAGPLTGTTVLVTLLDLVDRYTDRADDELGELLDELATVVRRGRAAVRRVQRDASDERPEAAAPVSECRKASDTASAGDRVSTPAATNSVSRLQTVGATSPPWTPAVDWRSTYEAPPGRHRKPDPVAAEATTPIPAVVTPPPPQQQTGQAAMTTTPQSPEQPGQVPPGWPPPGSPPPGYYQAPPPKKRRRWPWIVGAIVALLFIIGIASGGGEGTTSGTGPVVPGDAQQQGAPESVDVAFGSGYRWDNEEIMISPPREHVEDNMFLQPEGRYIEFDVTVRNVGDRDTDIIGTEITVVHNGRAAQEAFMAGSDAFPQGRIPPGGEVTFTQVYEIGAKPGELRVSVRPDLLAGTTAYFVGQV